MVYILNSGIPVYIYNYLSLKLHPCSCNIYLLMIAKWVVKTSFLVYAHKIVNYISSEMASKRKLIRADGKLSNRFYKRFRNYWNLNRNFNESFQMAG